MARRTCITTKMEALSLISQGHAHLDKNYDFVDHFLLVMIIQLACMMMTVFSDGNISGSFTS